MFMKILFTNIIKGGGVILCNNFLTETIKIYVTYKIVKSSFAV